MAIRTVSTRRGSGGLSPLSSAQPVPRRRIEFALSENLRFAQLFVEFNREAGGAWIVFVLRIAVNPSLEAPSETSCFARSGKQTSLHYWGAPLTRHRVIVCQTRVTHGLRQGCRNGSKDSWSEIRKASRARAPDSPMSGEGRKPEWPDHRRRAVDVGLAAAVGSSDQGQLTQRRNEVTQLAVVGNGEGVEHDVLPIRSRTRFGKRIAHHFPQDVETDEVRKASRARAPDSPMPGEHMDVRTARPTENNDSWKRRGCGA
jgi:hypothetical protein